MTMKVVLQSHNPKACLICERIDLIREGENPFFVAETKTGFIVLTSICIGIFFRATTMIRIPEGQYGILIVRFEMPRAFGRMPIRSKA